MGGEGTIEQDVSFGSMDEEERSAIALTVNGYERVPICFAGSTEQDFCEQPRGRGIVEDGEGCGVSQLALDEREQLRRSDGVTTESKEFIIRADTSNIEYTAPEGNKSLKQFRLRFR